MVTASFFFFMETPTTYSGRGTSLFFFSPCAEKPRRGSRRALKTPILLVALSHLPANRSAMSTPAPMQRSAYPTGKTSFKLWGTLSTASRSPKDLISCSASFGLGPSSIDSNSVLILSRLTLVWRASLTSAEDAASAMSWWISKLKREANRTALNTRRGSSMKVCRAGSGVRISLFRRSSRPRPVRSSTFPCPML